MKRLVVALLLAGVCLGQQPPSDEPTPEERALSNALGEAGSSPIEFIRAIENHLSKYPQTKRRAELERALAKAAIELKDEKRIIQYGERVLERESDDLQLLDRVARALLSSDARETSERALKYARKSEEVVRKLAQNNSGSSKAQWQDEVDRALGRALVLQSRATGNLGKLDEAAALARNSYETYPSAEAAREAARWLSRAGKDQDAVAFLADAFTISDSRKTDSDMARDRVRMGELYSKINAGSEKGLGDLVLQAYDRTTTLLAERKLRMRELDPNLQLTKIMDFTLSGPKDRKLKLASLSGKTLVFDFWATWCGPCRAQHPLYEQVKKRFKDKPEVVFLSVSTDEDRENVEPFLKEHQWEQAVYFDDGLARMLQIASIPTTIIVDRRGEVFSRMNGYVPERFVDMLTQRIEEALRN